jgi:hypothetical protein
MPSRQLFLNIIYSLVNVFLLRHVPVLSNHQQAMYMQIQYHGNSYTHKGSVVSGSLSFLHYVPLILVYYSVYMEIWSSLCGEIVELSCGDM